MSGIEQRVARIEEYLDLNGIHNKCDRCGRLDTTLFKVCGTFAGEKRYCFRCVFHIYVIGVEYYMRQKLRVRVWASAIKGLRRKLRKCEQKEDKE